MRQVFIGIMPEILGERFAYIGTSASPFLHAERGEIGSRDALDFLHSLHTLQAVYAKQDCVARFVWYAATRDVEMIARDLDADCKDRMFPSEEYLEKRRQLFLEREAAELEFARADRSDEAAQYQLKARLKELRAQQKHLEYVWPATNGVSMGYRLTYYAGKTLTIGKQTAGGKVRNLVTIYDLFSFFRVPLQQAAREHLNLDLRPIDAGLADLPIWERAVTDASIAQNRRECEALAQLGGKLQSYFADAGIYLQQWHGPSAAANYCLSKWNARDQFRPITKANAPKLLLHAIDRSFYGGRIELTKIGKVAPVYIYDLNAAYAHAICLLGKAVDRWRYAESWEDEPFSVWFIEYDLKDTPPPYLGPFPHRQVTGGVVWKQSGRGWYWWPEVNAAREVWGERIKVHRGYVMAYEPIDFADYIVRLYERRQELRAAKAPGQLALKLLLASLYGKFAQQVGTPRFHFTPWAAWVTSYVRAQLYSACAGHEEKVIGFAQDAIHATAEFPHLPLSGQIGQWKLSQYDEGFYVAPGIYELRRPNTIRRAMRGFEKIDFADARIQLAQSGTFKSEREFFVGWRLAQTFPLQHERSYLQKKTESFELRPASNRARQFLTERANLAWECVDSRTLHFDDGRESSQRKDARWLLRVFDMMIDVIKARRYENA